MFKSLPQSRDRQSMRVGGLVSASSLATIVEPYFVTVIGDAGGCVDYSSGV